MKLTAFVNELSHAELHEQHAWLLATVKRKQARYLFSTPENKIFLRTQIDWGQDRMTAIETELRYHQEKQNE